MFTRQPQAVEVYQAGAWWAGELLGWRHEVDGSCRMRVRVVLGGREETAWVDLAGLRLPEPGPVVPAPGGVRDPGATQRLPRTDPSRQERRPLVAGSATAEMPAARDLAGLPPAARSGGRRRAPEDSGTTVPPVQPALRQGGRRRAPEAPEPSGGLEPVPAQRSGGRRRAPESPGEGTPVVAADVVHPGGRHRAGAGTGAGRHRTADTGILAAVPSLPVPDARDEGGPSGHPRASWPGTGDAEPDLLTRPMRLTDRIPQARHGRVHGTLSSA